MVKTVNNAVLTTIPISGGFCGVGAFQFGVANEHDIPAAGDYDGDGKTDLAVFRQPTGQ